MKSRVQEEIPQVTFTMLRGGKGYLVEEVNVYIETIRKAYLVLEEEYNTRKEENMRLIAKLDHLKDGSIKEEALHKKQIEALHIELTMLKKQLHKVQEASVSAVPDAQEKINRLSMKLEESEVQRKALAQRLADLESSNEALQAQREKITGITEKFRQHMKDFREQRDVLENEIKGKDEEIQRLQQMQHNSAVIERPFAMWEKPAEVREKPTAVHSLEMDTVDYAAHFLNILDVGEKAKERQTADKQKMEPMPAKPMQGAEETRQASQRRAVDMLRSAHEELAEIRKHIKFTNGAGS